MRFPTGLAVVALLAAVCLAGCDAATFEPSGENYRDEVSPPTTGISVDLAESGDTLVVWGDLQVRYAPELDGKPFRHAELYLDGELIERKGRLEPFELRTTDLTDGSHTLGLVVYAGASTGSLADVLGAEAVYASVERTLLVDNAPPTPVAITAVGPEDGRLTVRWERYDRPGFERYLVYRNYDEFLGAYTSRDSTMAVDRLYVGDESAAYRVIVLAAEQQAAGAWVEYEAPGARLTTAALLGPYQAHLAWQPTPFFASVTAYLLERRRPGESEWALLSASATDTSFVDELPERLGQEYIYRLRVERAGRYPLSAGLDELTAGRPAPFGLQYASVAYGSVFYLQATNAVIGVLGDELVRAVPGTDQIVATAPYTGRPFATRDGTRLFAADGPLLHKLDPQSLQTVATLDLRPLYGSDVLAISATAGADGRVLFTQGRRIGVGGVQTGIGVLAVDFDAAQPLGRLSGGGRTLGAVSPSGRYAIVHGNEEGFGGDLYELTGDGFARLRDGFGRYVAFLDDDRLLALSGGSGTLYAMPSGDVLAEYATDAGGPPVYDAASGLFAGVTASELPDVVVFDPETGAEQARVPITSSGFSPAPFMFADRAVWVNGTYRRLDLP